MNTVTLATPISRQVQQEVEVTEVEIIRIVELVQKKTLLVFTNIGRVVLWEGDELDAVHEQGGHTHEAIEARLAEVLNA